MNKLSLVLLAALWLIGVEQAIGLYAHCEAIAQPIPLDPSENTTEKRNLPRRIEVKRVIFLGNNIFSEEELNAVVEPWIGKEATFADLIDMRSAVTDFYVERGYTTSAAFLPPQNPEDGAIQIQVVEGELDRIEIEGIDNPRTQAYVRSRVRRLAGSPFSQEGLLQALQLLDQDPLFDQVQAELDFGRGPGLDQLELSLTPAPPWQATFQLDNNQNPAAGTFGATARLANQNLIGFGDRLEVGSLFTEGVTLWDINYALPVNALDGTLSVGYRENTLAVTQEEFEDLDIEAEANTFFLSARQPVIRRVDEELAFDLSFELSNSNTFLEGDRFPFDLSTVESEGRSRVRALRFGQDYLKRTNDSVFFVRSQFSLGLDIFDATDNEIGVDGTFFSWNGQLQYARQLNEGVVFFSRVTGQLTPDPLLPLEQLAIGGLGSVRGYDPGSRLGDNGVVASAEMRFEVTENDGWGTISVVPFFDIGALWNNGVDLEGVEREVFDPSVLASVGVGLRWEIGDFSVQTDFGVPLGDSTDIRRNLLFQIQYQPRFGLF